MNPFKQLIITLTLWLIMCSSLMSQSKHVAGLFPTIDHSATLGHKLSYSVYYFAAFPMVNISSTRSANDSYFHLLYAEQALSFDISDKLSFTGSYVFQRENVVYSNYTNENRFYLQLKFKQNFKSLNLFHRLRFDGRFVQNRMTKETPFTHRVRYLLGVDVPINQKHYFTAYEEAFFNTFKHAGAFYGENWAYAAIGRKLNPNNKVEVGILYVTWNIGANHWFNQYYFQLTWINHLDFRKKQS